MKRARKKKVSRPRRPFVLRPRFDLSDKFSIGPGKMDLLRLVGETGSISAAARTLDVSYKHAWHQIHEITDGFGKVVVRTETGGKKGGGAVLTPFGEILVEKYVALELHLNESSKPELEEFRRLLRRG